MSDSLHHSVGDN